MGKKKLEKESTLSGSCASSPYIYYAFYPFPGDVLYISHRILFLFLSLLVFFAPVCYFLFFMYIFLEATNSDTCLEKGPKPLATLS